MGLWIAASHMPIQHERLLALRVRRQLAVPEATKAPHAPGAESPLARAGSSVSSWGCGGRISEARDSLTVGRRAHFVNVPIRDSVAAIKLYTSPPSSHLQAVHRKPA